MEVATHDIHGVLHSLGVQSVMVVDDSPPQRMHAVALCRAMGAKVVYEACNGQEALAQLGMLHLPPDLMLVDLQMPVMDGVELIGKMHESGLRIPLLIVSSQQQDILEAVEAMCAEMQMPLLRTLTKPLAATHLESALQRYVHCSGRQSGVLALPTTLQVNAKDLCAALDLGQIDVHYQPKVDMRTGLVRGMEVLARWKHPVHGYITPSLFVALAEKEGLIHDLTTCVLQKAFAQAAQWKKNGFVPSLAINLSPHVLRSDSVVRDVSSASQQHGIDPAQVVLEITESAGVDHLGQAIALLTRLRLQGFGLSIDDYGTGFSSMQQLARLPFTELKIDRSFVHGAHERRSLSVILESALDMAKRLGLVSVAEGVETLEDWRLLQRYGCSVGQGYLIAKPMPASDIPGWLRQYRTRLDALRILKPARAPQA